MMCGLERPSTGAHSYYIAKNSSIDYVAYSLVKLERLFYLYVWVAFGRMPLVNNDIYLELAKMDFNRCQALHQLECSGLQK